MIDYKEAQKIIKSQELSLEKELIDLDDALGRVLAEDIIAERDYPPFNRSAMDGIAIRVEDFGTGIRTFNIRETIFAGQNSKHRLSVGQCYKIMTGAAVPPSANAVIRKEDFVEQEGCVIVLSNNCLFFQNIAKRGQDLQKSDIALHAPFKINASAIGLLGSLGKRIVCVYKTPEVVILTTGNEVISLDRPVDDLQIYNSNLHMLKALLLGFSIKPAHTDHVLDDENQLINAIRPYLEADILILNGGVSAGDADFIPLVLSKLGVTTLFHKVAIKPGKPVLCGKLPGGGLVFALPGNPLSCLVTFKLFVELYLGSICNTQTQKRMLLPVNFNRVKKSTFDEFFPVSITERGVVEIDSNGSGDIRMASFGNGLAIQPATVMDICPGDQIVCFSL